MPNHVYMFIDFRKRGKETEMDRYRNRETLLPEENIPWLLLILVLTRDRTHNPVCA